MQFSAKERMVAMDSLVTSRLYKILFMQRALSKKSYLSFKNNILA